MEKRRDRTPGGVMICAIGILASLLLGLPIGPLLAQHEGHGTADAPSAGGHEGHGGMPGHAAPNVIVAWLPTLFWIGLAAFAVWLVVQTIRGRRPKWFHRQVAFGLAAMFGTYGATAYVVKKFKRPGQMTVIEAQAMDMSVMKAPVGTAAVVTEKAERGAFDARVTYTGTVVAFNDEDIYPRVTGWIRQMPVYPGDRVKPGQLVTRLDEQELVSKVSEAAFARLSAEQMQAQMAAEEAQARAMQAQAAAEEDYARGGVTEAENELAAARAMIKQADREKASAQSAQRALRSEVEAAQEAEAQADAEVSNAQAELASMEADLAAAQANAASWRPRLKRSEVLQQKGAISLEELQRDEAEATAAEAMVSAAQAKVRRARAGVSNSEAGVRQAAAMVRAAEAKADQMQEDVDAAAARLDQAQASTEASRARVVQMRAMVTKAGASLQSANAGVSAAARKKQSAAASAAQMSAALTTASVVKGYTEIRASAPGVVTQRLVSPGVLVNPGTPILRIAQIDQVRLQANVAEQDVAGIRVGSPVRVTNMKDPGNVVETKVTAVFPAADPSARTVVVEALTPNPGHRFLPGQYISMEIATQRTENAVTVPGSALVEVTPDQTGVFFTEKEKAVWVVRTRKSDPDAKTEYYCTMHPEVVSDKPGDCPKCLMKLEPRTKSGNLFASQVRVKVGPGDGKRTVILSGLEGGEDVITAGHRYLREGDAVAPRQNGDVDPAADGATGSHQGHEGHEGHAGVAPAAASAGSGKDLYTCPMHPEVMSDKPGQCPKCNMKLEKQAGSDAGAPAEHDGRAAGGTRPLSPVSGQPLYTCPMHPEVVSDKPGQQCPKCNMRLEGKA
ncbi:MAG: efflux RND transporter periplasmic adaptor subunit [Armatimonadetes bacterium]|nr:efflux RND transporter periplasmic adaptor subunit [Armatimonadota bacterium]